MDGDILYKEFSKVDNENKLATYIDNIRKDHKTDFRSYLKEIMDRKGVDRSSLYRSARIERTYVYQLLDGRRLHPGKDKVIMIALALQMNVDEVKNALEYADTGCLSIKSVRDSILLYSIKKKNSIAATNALLEQFGEKPLE
ncbi:MAG: XRE family transcriptional regulator [Clostridiales bacterium]|nr:XRE family transcriptional regulator [Clostridiales bacterium]